MPRRIDRFLVDEHGVDDTAHLDELLPIAAITGKPRHLPRRDCADLAEADLRHHPVKANARDATGGRRSAEIVIDRLDAGPAERCQAIAHRVLKRAALPVVQHLMGRRLPYIQERLAFQMVCGLIFSCIMINALPLHGASAVA